MKRFFCVVAIWVTLGSIGLAQQDPQDPGIQDSIIVNIFTPDSVIDYIPVQIYAVTDDSVMYYNIPLRWSTIGGEVIPDTVFSYFPPLTLWDDCFDTVLIAEGYIRLFGYADLGGDPNPPLLGDWHRVEIATFKLVPTDYHFINVIIVDSTWDSRNGSLILGLSDGISEVTPAFERGYCVLSGIDDDNSTSPNTFSLSPNYPNPFNSNTLIVFTLDKDQYASLMVYDLQGRKIRSLVANNLTAGEYNIIWDGRDNTGVDVVSGIYYYRLSASDRSITNKMLLLR
jgi:hypothetical protein